MDVIGPNNFCVVNESMTPQLQTLKDHMNLVSSISVKTNLSLYLGSSSTGSILVNSPVAIVRLRD